MLQPMHTSHAETMSALRRVNHSARLYAATSLIRSSVRLGWMGSRSQSRDPTAVVSSQRSVAAPTTVDVAHGTAGHGYGCRSRRCTRLRCASHQSMRQSCTCRVSSTRRTCACPLCPLRPAASPRFRSSTRFECLCFGSLRIGSAMARCGVTAAQLPAAAALVAEGFESFDSPQHLKNNRCSRSDNAQHTTYNTA